ncbi:cyclase family protein [Robertkochia marina]|uniref:Cyclase family protein n=2 Tax=Robertkochia marina TaxID=1227945 RepID=A0A4S3M0Z4_9FLAO|nr:cyclase family protein [Robertkochia marina]TRZ43463.1 cyclase family protein [Robertkochia marina]
MKFGFWNLGFGIWNFLILCAAFLAGCTQQTTPPVQTANNTLDKMKIVDLTHDFSRETVYWVTAKEFELDTVFAGVTEQGFYYTANDITTAEHGGTHIDAPIHFAEGKLTVDQIPLESLMGAAIKIDVSEKALQDPDYLISVDDIDRWEQEENTPIPDGSIVLFYTGHSTYYPDKKKYLGTEQRGEEALDSLHFPGISPEAAQWLIDNRNIKAVGLDTPSLDYGQSKNFKTHVILLSENVPGFENLANLEQLPASGFQVIALPMKIKGGSGGPLRMIAIMNP